MYMHGHYDKRSKNIKQNKDVHRALNARPWQVSLDQFTADFRILNQCVQHLSCFAVFHHLELLVSVHSASLTSSPAEAQAKTLASGMRPPGPLTPRGRRMSRVGAAVSGWPGRSSLIRSASLMMGIKPIQAPQTQ